MVHYGFLLPFSHPEVTGQASQCSGLPYAGTAFRFQKCCFWMMMYWWLANPMGAAWSLLKVPAQRPRIRKVRSSLIEGLISKRRQLFLLPGKSSDTGFHFLQPFPATSTPV